MEARSSHSTNGKSDGWSFAAAVAAPPVPIAPPSTVACGACSNVFEVQKPQLSSASVGPTRQEILWQTMHDKPARNGASWSADEDREVWDVLGQFPRTASGGLSTANGVGRLVRQVR